MDENGIMLSVQEVRERLRDGRPVILNEEANRNNQKKITKENFLESYMTKKLYNIKKNKELSVDILAERIQSINKAANQSGIAL